VSTKSILTAANVPLIGGHHVLALQSSPEGWQATPLLERCREHGHLSQQHDPVDTREIGLRLLQGLLGPLAVGVISPMRTRPSTG
jgi:hypothetical protein